MEEEQAKSKKRRQRISMVTATLMIGTALFIDFMQVLLVIFIVFNWIIDVIAGIGLWLWFRLNDVSFMDRLPHLGTASTGLLVESAPLFNALPAWTIATAVLIYFVRQEDKRYNSSV